ncbi:chemotaxis protein CheC [uncultured Ferrimonas sp.]|uniref:chemotaxis protein CheC n=1 Tax=uncultured Ferrimonas sp. TaxID=432640 RepID=UPI00262AC1D5|nr:chemotaxis protein CheC [uncultured Ferrimonas sp.]
MNQYQLSADELDALRELTNIGMGRAGAKLSEVFESKVKLSVPQVEFGNQSTVTNLVQQFGRKSDPVNIVQQEFMGQMLGRSSLLFGGSAINALMEYLGYDDEDAKSQAIQKEIFNELTNVINSASLSGLSEAMQLDVHLAQPVLVEFETRSELVDANRLLDTSSDQVLLIDIKLEIEEKGVHCDNIISLRPEGLQHLISSLRALMA